MGGDVTKDENASVLLAYQQSTDMGYNNLNPTLNIVLFSISHLSLSLVIARAIVIAQHIRLS